MQCRSTAPTAVAPLQASEAANELRAARQRGGGSGKKDKRARGEDSDDEAVWAAHMESEEEEPDLESLVRSKVGSRLTVCGEVATGSTICCITGWVPDNGS